MSNEIMYTKRCQFVEHYHTFVDEKVRNVDG